MNYPHCDRMVVVSEIPHGSTLQDWLDGGGAPTARQVVKLVAALADVLAAAHAQGVIHGGVVAENVWLDAGEMSPFGTIQLRGLGVARLRQTVGGTNERDSSGRPEVSGDANRRTDAAEELAQLATLAEKLLSGGASKPRLVPQPIYRWPPTTVHEVQPPSASAVVRAVLVRAQAPSLTSEQPFGSPTEFATALEAAVLEHLRAPLNSGTDSPPSENHPSGRRLLQVALGFGVGSVAAAILVAVGGVMGFDPLHHMGGARAATPSPQPAGSTTKKPGPVSVVSPGVMFADITPATASVERDRPFEPSGANEAAGTWQRQPARQVFPAEAARHAVVAREPLPLGRGRALRGFVWSPVAQALVRAQRNN